MAQTIIGLDIGSYSVKVASLTTSFRSVAWTGFREIVIPREQRERPENVAMEVLKELSKDPKTRNAVVVTALPGDRAMTRFLTFPFSDPKRIDSVLGFELQNRVPLTIAEMVYTFQVTGPTDAGKTEIFAAACKKTTLSQYLEAISGAGLDPRVVTLDTASYLNLYDQLVKEGAVAFVDIGHKTTKICVVKNGRLCLARSLGRGGLAVTRAIQQVLGCDMETAEATKHDQGSLPLPVAHGGPPPTPLARAVAEAMHPLVAALRQTFQAAAGERSTNIDRVLITGGGAQLEGLTPWLEAELGRPVERLAIDTIELNKVPGLTHSDVAAKGVGLALVQAAASKHRTTLDFRRNEFAYAGDFEFLQDRLKSLTAMAAILIIVGSGWAVVKNQGLERQLAEQRDQLADFTDTTLGERLTSFTKTLKMLETPPTQAAEQDLFPPMTAVAVLDIITVIQAEMNGAAHAGGPQDPPVPMGRPGIAPGRLQPGRPGAMPARPIGPDAARPPGLRTPRPLPGSPGGPFIPPGSTAPVPGTVPERPGMPTGEAPADPALGPDGLPPGVPPPPGGEAPVEAPVVVDTSKIELSNVDVDVFGDVTITAETHESNVNGKELFRQKLEEQRCFKEVKRRDIGEVVTASDGRHADWIRFEVTFKLKCPKVGDEEGDDAKKDGAKKEGARKGAAADGGTDSPGDP